MAFADGNFFRCSFTVPAALVPADQTNFAVLLSGANMPAALVSFLAAAGGGSLRAYADDAQVTRYALEYVSSGEVWICAPSLSSVTDTTIWLFWGGALSQPAVGDAYGRNATWAAWSAVYHLQADATDSVGTSSGVVTGTPDPVAGVIGGGLTWGVGEYAIAPPVALSAQSGALSMQLDVSAGTTYRVALGYSSASAALPYLVFGITPSEQIFIQFERIGYVTRQRTVASFSGWHHVYIASTGSGYTIHVDGADQALASDVGTNSGEWLGDTSVSGSRLTPSCLDRLGQVAGLQLLGSSDEVRIGSSGSALCEYRAQSDPATFAVAGTIDYFDPGGAFADGNLFGAPITIPAAQVPANQTNFAVLLSSANMPAALLSFLAASGGGSLRAYLDEAQSVRYALEYVSATEVWVCAPSLSSATDTTIWLFWGGALSQPAVGDAYGRNATWSDWTAVYHMGQTSPTDSTATGADATLVGNGSVVAGVIGSAVDYGAQGFARTAAGKVVGFADGSWTMLHWLKRSGTPGNFSRVLSIGKEPNVEAVSFLGHAELNSPLLQLYNGTDLAYPYTAGQQAPTFDGAWHMIACRRDKGADLLTWHRDAVQRASTASLAAKTFASDGPIAIGVAPYSGGEPFWGQQDEIRLRASALSDNDILCHYRAQSSPATFATFGTIVEAPSGGAITTLWSYYGC